MEYAFGWDVDGARVVLWGELDTHAVATHEAALLAAVDGPFVIDASSLGFVSSHGLRLLLRLAEGNAGTVQLLGAPPALRRLVEITGTGEQLVVGDRRATGRSAGGPTR